MNLFICNIGTRDVDWDQLPGMDRRASQRQRSMQVLDTFPQMQPHLRLPLIARALRYALQSGPIARLVLVASDQEAADARNDRESDTCYTAEIVRRMLISDGEHWRAFPEDAVVIWLIGEDGTQRDPSDYDAVRRFFERRLPPLAQEFPDARAFLEVTGGTPAMTTGLLIAGSEAFGDRAEAIYIQPSSALPSVLNTSRRLAAGPLRATLRTHTANYNYAAALDLVGKQRNTLGDRLRPGAIDVMEPLLAHAASRFNLDLVAARRALEGGADRAGDGQWRQPMMRLYDEIEQPDRNRLLSEVFHGAVARFQAGALADFLTQVVRFQENAYRTLCLRMGARFLNRAGQPTDDGSQIDRTWAQTVGFPLRKDTAYVSRKTLRDLAVHLDRRHGGRAEPTIRELDTFDGLAHLRNDLTHTFTGVHLEDLSARLGGRPASAIVPQMTRVLGMLTSRPPDESPFARINQLVDELLHEA